MALWPSRTGHCAPQADQNAPWDSWNSSRIAVGLLLATTTRTRTPRPVHLRGNPAGRDVHVRATAYKQGFGGEVELLLQVELLLYRTTEPRPSNHQTGASLLLRQTTKRGLRRTTKRGFPKSLTL